MDRFFLIDVFLPLLLGSVFAILFISGLHLMAVFDGQGLFFGVLAGEVCFMVGFVVAILTIKFISGLYGRLFGCERR